MNLIFLKKKVDGFRSGNGQLQRVPADLLLELRQAWESFEGPMEDFRRELGMKVGTLRKLLVESKKLNHVLASTEAVGIPLPGGEGEVNENGAQLKTQAGETEQLVELIYDRGDKVIRFPSVDTLVEFLRKAS